MRPSLRKFPKRLKLQTNRRRSHIVRKHTASTFLIDLPCVVVSASGNPLVVQSLILLLKVTGTTPLQQMMNLLLPTVSLHFREANEASKVSGVIFQPAQVLPHMEARGVHFVRNYACKDWLREDHLTVSA